MFAATGKADEQIRSWYLDACRGSRARFTLPPGVSSRSVLAIGCRGVIRNEDDLSGM